jgi:hypothetical protein
MSEVVCAFVGTEARQEEADAAAKVAFGSLGGFAQKSPENKSWTWSSPTS